MYLRISFILDIIMLISVGNLIMGNFRDIIARIWRNCWIFILINKRIHSFSSFTKCRIFFLNVIRCWIPFPFLWISHPNIFSRYEAKKSNVGIIVEALLLHQSHLPLHCVTRNSTMRAKTSSWDTWAKERLIRLFLYDHFNHI